jgi:hypothetical protein
LPVVEQTTKMQMAFSLNGKFLTSFSDKQMAGTLSSTSFAVKSSDKLLEFPV